MKDNISLIRLLRVSLSLSLPPSLSLSLSLHIYIYIYIYIYTFMMRTILIPVVSIASLTCCIYIEWWLCHTISSSMSTEISALGCF